MSSPRATLLAIVLLLVTFSNTCTASSGKEWGCLNYGHSCLGAHGKRSGTGATAPPAAQKALMEVLMAALLAASTTAVDHDNTLSNAMNTRVQHIDDTAMPEKPSNSLSPHHGLSRPSHNNVILNARPESWFPINTDLLEGLAQDAQVIKPEDMPVQSDDMLYAYDTEDARDNVDDYERSNSAKTMSTWNPRRMQAILQKEGVDLSKLGNWIRR